MTQHDTRLSAPGFTPVGALVADLLGKLAAARECGAIERPELYTASAIRRRALAASRRIIRPIREKWDFEAQRYVDQDPADTRTRILQDFRRRYPFMLGDAARYVAAAHRGHLERVSREARERAILAATEPAGDEIEDMRQQIWVINCYEDPTPDELRRKADLHRAIELDSATRRLAAMRKLGFA